MPFFRGRLRLLPTVAAAGVLLVGGSRPAVAQTPQFTRHETPFSVISRILLRKPLQDSVVHLAVSQVGLAYRYGAKLPGKAFDCSGLVQWVMSKVDLVVPRTARLQSTAGVPVPRDRSQLLPGDLLFFGRGGVISHVGIYVGGGRYIHAANRKLGIVEATLPTGVAARTWWRSVRRVIDPNAATVVGVSRDSLVSSS